MISHSYLGHANSVSCVRLSVVLAGSRERLQLFLYTSILFTVHYHSRHTLTPACTDRKQTREEIIKVAYVRHSGVYMSKKRESHETHR
jgi:hypothetical protein